MIFSRRRTRRLLRLSVSAAASITLAAGTVLVVSSGAHAGLASDRVDKIRPEVQAGFDSAGRAAFWVRFTDRADLSAAGGIDDWVDRGQAVAATLRKTAADSQAAVIDQLDRAGLDYEAFWATNAIFVRSGPEALARQIAARPEVQGLYAPVGYELIEPTPAETKRQINALEWNIANVNADDVWNQFGARGEGITVANIDTGVQYDHPALAGQYRGNLGNGAFDHNYNWFDAAGTCADAPCDGNGHGTHTMGTMVGDDGGENQIGVAPHARWIAANGCCPSDAALIASGQWMLEPTDLNGANPDASMRPHIINNSWGSDVPSTDPFMEDVLNAWAASGIFGMWSNGNDGGQGCNSSGSPGSRIISYSAGAYDINNNIAGFSARGPGQDGELKPNIAAPGVNVRSALPNDTYGAFDGTSMAAPHVAGAVALLWSATPTLIGDTTATKTLLDDTATNDEDLQCGGTTDDNNVYGEGRLDALALLNAAPTQDAGRLQGTVTDAATTNPIQGATITITGALTDDLVTGPDGTYTIALPAGDHTVTATAFGYLTQTADVTITPGQTVIRDFAMTATPVVTVTGTIHDDSGHGWPLYTKVTVQGTSVTDYTNPFNGRYSLRLPGNATYTLTAETQYPGYQTITDTITVTTSNLTHNINVPIDPFDCSDTPGYEFEAELAMITTDPGDQFAEYFESLGAEVDFFTVSQLDQVVGYDTVLWGYNPTAVNQAAFLSFLDATDASGAGLVFLDHAFTTWNGIKTLSRHTGQPATVSTSTGGVGQPNFYEVTHDHEILDGLEVGQRIVHEPQETGWLAWFDGYEGDGRQIIADVGRGTGTVSGAGIGVQERSNNRHALLSIHSSSATRGPGDWSEESERIFWNALQWVSPDQTFGCVPVEGGLVAGHVRDRNTGAGIDGATVTSVDDPEVTATTFATPDDLQRDDGFYWMFSALTGSHPFTASAENYVEQTRPADVAADGVTARNFQLAAGLLTVTPDNVSATMRLGNEAARTFRVTNEGTAPAQVQLVESGGAFEILGGNGAQSAGPGSGAVLRHVQGTATAAATPNGSGATLGPKADDRASPALSAHATAKDARSTPVLPQAEPNQVTITHSQSQDIIAGNSVACSPDNGITTTENGYLRTFTLEDFGIGGGFTVTDVSFGIENLTISQTLTVNLYTLEGDLLHENLTRIGTAEATLAPQELTLVTVPVTGFAPPQSTLVVEVDAPDMSGVGAFFIGSNDAGQTAPSYLRSESCGITEPTETGEVGFPGMHIVMNVTGEEGGGDIPWLSANPPTFTLNPGQTVRATVTLDGHVAQPGTYTADIAIAEDTPYTVGPVGVTMNITPPNNWGKITGTVTGLACDDSTGPLQDAIVHIDGLQFEVTLTTATNGTYAHWIGASNNPLQMVVAANNHIPQTRTARIIPRQTIVENFNLRELC